MGFVSSLGSVATLGPFLLTLVEQPSFHPDVFLVDNLYRKFGRDQLSEFFERELGILWKPDVNFIDGYVFCRCLTHDGPHFLTENLSNEETQQPDEETQQPPTGTTVGPILIVPRKQHPSVSLITQPSDDLPAFGGRR